MINVKFEDGINDLITENLYQWDTYQTLKISGIDFGTVSPTVHFANKKSIEALVVQGELKDDGSVEVSIPNFFAPKPTAPEVTTNISLFFLYK